MMTRISLILSFLFFFQLINFTNCKDVLNLRYNTTKNKKIVLIGIDGLLQACINESKNLESSWEYMISAGSYTFTARSTIAAYSAPGWSSILCGTPSEHSGITVNNWVPTNYFQRKNKISYHQGEDVPLNCIFEEIKKQNKDLINVSMYNWDWFIFLGNKVIPNTIDDEYYIMSEEYNEAYEKDDIIYKRAKSLMKSDFNFMFVYFGSLDTTGHNDRYCSPKYIKRLSDINEYIAGLFEEMKQIGILEETYVIITTDHGAGYNTLDHALQQDDNLIIPWLIKGPGIKKNYKIKANVRLMDTSPTILKILGLRQTKIWRGTSVDEIFDDNL
jgi:predicted AlkP superfamily pyrophosphatase or phosphodiesterase